MKHIRVQNMLLASMFTALTAIGAFIRIPIPPYPVPVTLQTAFVYLAALLLPKREAFLSQFVYVLLGLIGIPIFTNGGGLGYVLDPTFGYLIAFVIAAPLLSILAEKTLYKNRRCLFAFCGLSIALFIQVAGIAYMAAISSLYLHTPLPFDRALYLTLVFLPLDIVKLLLASILAGILWRRVPGIARLQDTV